ncbi:MAG: phosphate/phosphite/phosphonate ABC transporter substrate-binding protein, partial [Rhizobiaceae bacterium]
FANLPMYDWPEIHDETEALWKAIATRFRKAGIDAPEELHRDYRGLAHWLDPNLLFSQSCGYPFAKQLMGKVELLGTPVYSVEGCYGSNYSSAIVVRADDAVASLEDARQHRFAFNGKDSLSGFRCMTPLIANPQNYFSQSAESGGHRASAQMVEKGEADITAIDAVCWHLLQQVEPETANGLRLLKWGPLFPALPFITRVGNGSDELGAMHDALNQAIADVRDKLPTLNLRDIELLPAETYAPLAAL